MEKMQRVYLAIRCAKGRMVPSVFSVHGTA